MQQNSRCRLCRDRGEMIDQIISECSKLAQKEYKTWHDSQERIGSRTEGLGSNGTDGDCPNYSIVGIGQNMDKFYQQDYIIFSVQFLILILILG